MSPSPSGPPSPMVPGLKVPEPPAVDLGLLNGSRRARQAVGEAIKGAYLGGAADGFAIGQQVGYAAGRVGGVVEGASITAVVFGLICFCACILMRLSRR